MGFTSIVHDATVAPYLGARRIMERNETITGPKLATEIRLVNFIGGTGNISFDANGDRPDFAGKIIDNVKYNYSVSYFSHSLPDKTLV